MIWHSLDYLLEEFSYGADNVGVQEAFEICLYRAKIAKGELVFKQSRSSCLKKNLD